MTLKIALVAVSSFIAGIVLAGLAMVWLAPSLMMVENPSRLAYEETVQAIIAQAEALDWKVPAVHRLDKSMEKAGHQVLPAAVIELCRPDYAARLLQEDDTRVVASLMPCRVAVYQKSDGRVIVSRMNTTLMSKLFGGLVTQVMAAASADSEQIVGAVIH